MVPQSRIFCGRKRNLTQESSEKILSSMWESNPWHYNLSFTCSELLQTLRWTGLKFNQNKTSYRELFWYTTTKINKRLLYKTCWSINCPCISMYWITLPHDLLQFGVYLGVRTCKLFLCFVPFVFLGFIVLTSFFSLFYVTGEFNRFLRRGWAPNSFSFFCS